MLFDALFLAVLNAFCANRKFLLMKSPVCPYCTEYSVNTTSLSNCFLFDDILAFLNGWLRSGNENQLAVLVHNFMSTGCANCEI